MPPDDDLIDAAPCPSCRAPLTVSASDIGHLVECPRCGTQFRARRTGVSDPPPPPPAEDRPPEPRGERDEPPPWRRSDGRPPRRDDRDDRPVRRTPRYDDSDDDGYVRAPRRGKSGAVIAVAVLDFIYGGLILLCGLFFGVGGALSLDGGGGGPFGGRFGEGSILLGVALCLVGVGALFIVGGIGCVQHRSYGRVMSYIAASIALIMAGLAVVGMLLTMGRGGRGDPASCISGLISLCFWLGHAIPTFNLLGKTAREFR